MSADASSSEPLEFIVPESSAGMRLDWFLAKQLPQFSRVHLRKIINAAGVQIDGRRTKAAHKLREGERLTILLPELVRPAPEPENIPLEILFEDESLAVINKPAGRVVHPGKGHWKGTLTAALQFHFNELSTAGGTARPGIVHRLDRDTSGVLVVAKTDPAHLALAAQFEKRTIEKEYLAVVAGVPDRDRDIISQPVGAHPHQREKMAIRRDHHTSRTAETMYEVLERFDGFAVLKVLPKTGRTHQIRLHLGSIGCPVLCDRLYGGRATITRGEIRHDPSDATVLLARQALHARRLKFKHPVLGEVMEFVAPVPADIAAVVDELRAFRRVG